MEKSTLVTRPSLPPLEELTPYLESIWKSQWLTNSGPIHQKLEAALAEFLDIPFVSLFNNGTSALMAALAVLEVKGEVITTPFSFLATSHSVLWSGATPVFVDTCKGGFNIDPEKVEAAITENTSAILPVHCYGQPCDHEALQKIAKTHKLNLIYDGAHCFGVKENSKSVLNYGDLSIVSFHATKIFNTFEGGAVIGHSQEMKDRLARFRNFGLDSHGNCSSLGLNGKMSEVSAAMGMVQLHEIGDYIEKSKAIDETYRGLLKDCPQISIPSISDSVSPNYSYFPVLISPQASVQRDELCRRLEESQIFCRKYFSPLLSDMNINKKKARVFESLDNATRLEKAILCLPIYPDLEIEEVQRIAAKIIEAFS